MGEFRLGGLPTPAIECILRHLDVRSIGALLASAPDMKMAALASVAPRMRLAWLWSRRSVRRIAASRGYSEYVAIGCYYWAHLSPGVPVHDVAQDFDCLLKCPAASIRAVPQWKATKTWARRIVHTSKALAIERGWWPVERLEGASLMIVRAMLQ